MEQVYEITITGRENHTWQGHLCCGGGATPFRSEMELLLALDRLLRPRTSRRKQKIRNTHRSI